MKLQIKYVAIIKVQNHKWSPSSQFRLAIVTKNKINKKIITL